MSTALRVVALVGLCVLLAGCAPASSVKGILAIVAMVISLVAAAIGFTHSQDEDRVAQKGKELERLTNDHVRKYHS